MEAGKSRICSVGQPPRDPGKLMLKFQSKGWQVETRESSLSLSEAGLFVLLSSSTDWTSPTPRLGRTVHLLRVHRFKCYSHPKTLSKRTLKISHHVNNKGLLYSSGNYIWYLYIRDQTWVSCSAGRFFTIWSTGEAPYNEKNLQKKNTTTESILRRSEANTTLQVHSTSLRNKFT